MTQCESILAWLEAGNSLTKAQAFSMGWGLSLNSRVAELREQGHDIVCDTEKINGKTVYFYRLNSMVAYG